MVTLGRSNQLGRKIVLFRLHVGKPSCLSGANVPWVAPITVLVSKLSRKNTLFSLWHGARAGQISVWKLGLIKKETCTHTHTHETGLSLGLCIRSDRPLFNLCRSGSRLDLLPSFSIINALSSFGSRVIYWFIYFSIYRALPPPSVCVLYQCWDFHLRNMPVGMISSATLQMASFISRAFVL